MLNVFFAFAASVLTAVQTVLIALDKEAICFNDGCGVVESLTKVPPFFFNLAGFIFFLTLFYVLIKARKGPDGWRQLATLLLLGAMAAEGVLVAFQHFIANVFCSYCLIVFSFVVVMNLFMGLKQFLRGVAAFTAVLIAFSVLAFSSPVAKPITAGTYGTIAGKQDQGKLVLLFSETCPHCEEVIDSLRENNSCEISFNPISPLNKWSFDGLDKNSEFDPEVNIKYLTSLGINSIPTLSVYKGETISVLKGKFEISKYLAENCQSGKVTEEQSTEIIGQSSNQEYFSSPNGENYLYPDEDENCDIPGSTGATDCKE